MCLNTLRFMNNFVFQNPTKLIFGKGTISQLSSNLSKDVTVMVTYGGGSIKSNGVYDQVMKALEGFDVVEFSGIEPNPHYETLMKGVALAKEKNVGFLLAVGGGSVIDGTKFMAAAIKYDSDPWEFMYNPSLIEGKIEPIPLASVLTLPATGSEMNSGAVITKAETKEKLAFFHSKNYPKFSILDPEVCYSLPKRQLANGVTDTFVHVMEQYLTYPSAASVQDRWAEGVLLTLKEIGVKIVENNKDYDIASNYMYSATMGLNGFIAMGVPQDWATHMIGHELTAFHGLDHGVTLAIVSPSLYNVTREEKKEKLLQYGERVWGINSGSEECRIDATIEATRNFYESLGIKTHLKEYGITENDVEIIVKRFKDRKIKLGEKGTITSEVVRQILMGAM